MDYIWSPWRYQYRRRCWLESSLNVFFCDAVAGRMSGNARRPSRREGVCHPESLPYTSGT